ncbi:MAG TPA: HAMP domain-containing sensor histidine kinase [Spirochaetia bacterium]|nr:HAMP domain-containing sensor histidine kinase [Spirochaetia bacterium]
MPLFELDPTSLAAASHTRAGKESLGGTVLLSNARWFTRVRWIAVVGFLCTASVFQFFPDFGTRIVVARPGPQFWILAGYLACANLVLLFFAGRLDEQSGLRSVKAHMWSQIAVDLLAVTYLVHTVGSVETFISFTFLFHIALSCVFFAPRESLLVVVAAAGLYLISVGLELVRVWPNPGIFGGVTSVVRINPTLALLFALSAVFVWLVIWYFISTLSQTVRSRDAELRRMNNALSAANKEKNRIMLVTTHDLKAPFSGIESNAKILRDDYWTALSEPVREIVERIEMRAKTLRERINAILLLGELRSNGATDRSARERVDLGDLMRAVLEDVSDRAAEREVVLDVQVPRVVVLGTARQFLILFTNIVANAISYSHVGGTVQVRAEVEGNFVLVTVTDRGIGIRQDALAHIFEEYYRTREGARFNRSSTGLGLAIVKEIAEMLELRIRVASEEDKGTVFTVIIPALVA